MEWLYVKLSNTSVYVYQKLGMKIQKPGHLILHLQNSSASEEVWDNSVVTLELHIFLRKVTVIYVGSDFLMFWKN